ncbi:ABC-type nitrate/sulfonate/bicarbonate transport system substrate-binding protein [Rhizobium sp. BK226]|nr:ABC-type nitrate/sulfonate/bicarbonate transport system substrate-binding protein [Rhizobium sp. BK226]
MTSNAISEIWYTRCPVPTPVGLAANGPEVHRHLGLGLQPELVEAVGHYKDFLRDFGFLAADFDIAEWIDRRHLEAFAKRAVA